MQDGLIVSGIGLGTVFVVLLLLGIVILVLGKIETVLAGKGESEPGQETVSPAPAESDDANVPAEVVAAIGATIAMAEAETAAPAPVAVRSGATGSWLQSGRFREMDARSTGPRRRP